MDERFRAAHGWAAKIRNVSRRRPKSPKLCRFCKQSKKHVASRRLLLVFAKRAEKRQEALNQRFFKASFQIAPKAPPSAKG